MQHDSTDFPRASCRPHFQSISLKLGVGSTGPLTERIPANQQLTFQKGNPIVEGRASVNLRELP